MVLGDTRWLDINRTNLKQCCQNTSQSEVVLNDLHQERANKFHKVNFLLITWANVTSLVIPLNASCLLLAWYWLMESNESKCCCHWAPWHNAVVQQLEAALSLVTSEFGSNSAHEGNVISKVMTKISIVLKSREMTS